MHSQTEIHPVLDVCIQGPYKQWKSIKQIRIEHLEVRDSLWFLWMKGIADSMRAVTVTLEFTNGARFISRGTYHGATHAINELAIERALKEFSRRGSIASVRAA